MKLSKEQLEAVVARVFSLRAPSVENKRKVAQRAREEAKRLNDILRHLPTWFKAWRDITRKGTLYACQTHFANVQETDWQIRDRIRQEVLYASIGAANLAELSKALKINL
jgi:type III secretory pathway component EscR